MTTLQEQADAARRELGITLPSPLRDRNVIIKHTEWWSHTDEGIEIRHSDSLPRIFGVVVMVGDKVNELQYADHIVFHRHSGTPLTIKEQEFYMLHVDDCIAVLPPDESPEMDCYS